MLVARDALGVKPLYYTANERGVAFCSEIKGLLDLVPEARELDPVALHRYLSFLWCPGEGTPLKAVRKLLPGEAMVLRGGKITRRWTWYQLPAFRGVRADLNEQQSIEGTAAHAESRHAETRAVLAAHGGTSLGEEAAKSWEKGRFDAPYLRDSLLKAGALCETLETATCWSNIPTLKAAVTEALTASLTASGTSALVMCHISHVYPTGASLYFTVVAGQRGDAAAQWHAAKVAASDAIVANGATITHHHAVGADHRHWMPAEIGELGVQILGAVKQAVDPAGILNPGKLIP
jgi:FAD/FMN-containing dehydrogenase